MPTEIPHYTDNEKYVLNTVLKTLITEYQQTNLDLATGFFSPKVWDLVGNSFEHLEHLRLMIGKEPDPKLEKRGLNLAKYFRAELKTQLEGEKFTSSWVKTIESLVTFLQRDTVQVRLFDDPFLHAKAYIFDQYAIVGSNNFTPNGLINNSELSLINHNAWISQGLRRDWFDSFWQRANEYKAELIDTLERSKFGSYPYTPFEVFLKVLFENYRESLEPNSTAEFGAIELAAFQEEGFRLARQLLEKFGGVMIADAVGLGKSFMGLSILEEFLIKRREKGNIPRGLVVCPAQLERLVWRPLLDRYGIAATIVTMESMGRDDFDWRKYAGYDLVVVDESHNFRKASTGRYQNLMRMLQSGKADKKVALLTATPVNNSIWDVYQQLRLMTRGREDHFASVGIPNMFSFFTQVSRGRAEFYDLMEHTMVRRSRRDVKRRQEQGEKILINGSEIRFPERTLHRIEYSLFDQFGGVLEEFVRRIEKLKLVGYNLERYKKTGQVSIELDRREALAGIFKTNFLKRLESSLDAFKHSLQNQMEFQKRFYEQFKMGRVLDAGVNRRIQQVLRQVDSEDEGENTPRLERLLESLAPVDSLLYKIADMEADLQSDLRSLEWMTAKIKDLMVSRSDSGEADSKLRALKVALLEQAKGQKVILFSYYHDTADYVYRALTRDDGWMNAMGISAEHIALISGASKGGDRADTVRRFAPEANRKELEQDAYQKLLERPIDILVSTDVLSEGQNLQDAGILINVDLHWNPVRMIQRAGRIDRLGSAFERLEIYNTFPEAGLEQLLGLVERLQNRIADIDRTVGLDASVLGEVISKKSLEELRRIRTGDAEVLDELEAENELSVADEMRLPLVAALQNLGREYINELPLGIHSSRAVHGAKRVFIALKVGDRAVWRVYPLNPLGSLEGTPQATSQATPQVTESVLTSKREIYRLIEALPTEPRAENPEGVTIFSYLERAIKDVVKDSKRAIKQATFKPIMKGATLILHAWLSDMYIAAALEETMRKRLIYTLENRSLSGFEKETEFSELLKRFKPPFSHQSTHNIEQLALSLEGFLVDNQLIADPPDERVTTKTIQENDVELIAFEWLV
jgi:superfamily II DNA or RNA helicase